MRSLRARLLASVLLLSAAGLLALAAVTYTEQRSFLEDRLNQQVRQAGPGVSQALDNQNFKAPAGTRCAAAAAAHHDTHGRPGDGQGPNLPPGTFGQRRDPCGHVLGKVLISYTQTAIAEPLLPAALKVGALSTVGSTGSSGLRYRVYATRDFDDANTTVVALPLTDVKQTLSRLLIVEALVIAGVLVALALISLLVVRLGLRPLSRMEVTAGEIAGGELSHRVTPATPKTEVGRLGVALNAMLDRLEQAFAARQASEERLRQFLADASHELRTPLASIRGYAELFRMGAAADAADTAMAMRRIEEEAKRMGVLVEDLLTLARLDETPELKRSAVDLNRLAQDAVHDAAATAPDRRISLQPTARAIVSGDADQLRQVLANLMRNALVHTPAGTPIEVTMGEDEHSVTLAVRDHGPGLPSASREKLFGRFWRAEGGRERGKAGAGLGLAIAHGIVEAHGGEIAAEDAAGGGAVFVVRLPRSPAPPHSAAEPVAPAIA
jgi:two-component system OmpR family sensor kinase